MSSVVTRMVLAAGVVLVGALFAYFQQRPQAETHDHERRRGGRRRPSPPTSAQRWEWDNDDNDYPPPPRSRPPPLPLAKDFDCLICTSSYVELMNSRSEILMTSCGHVFCGKCIRKYISDGSASCPVCRQYMTEAELSRVYLH